jgi:hypothetical protein
MQVTFDSSEPLERVLPVVAAVYGVELTSAAELKPRGKRNVVPAASGRRSRRAKPDAGDVRTWARANGHQVSDRGRVPAAILNAYLAEK